MGSVAHYFKVNAATQRCYDWWRPLIHLPDIFPDLLSVEIDPGDADTTHWSVAGPAGRTVAWDARIVADDPGRTVAWERIEPTRRTGHDTIFGSRMIRFDSLGDTTGIEVSLCFDPPDEELRAMVALFAEPQTLLERAMETFKNLMEREPR